MNKPVAIQLLCYSLLLVGLGLLANHLAPDPTRPTLFAALAGGILCALWAVWALAGKLRKILPVLTLVPVSFVLLSQMVTIWAEEARKGQGQRRAAIVITFLFVVSIAMLMRVAYAGLSVNQENSRATGVSTGASGKGSANRSAPQADRAGKA